MLPTPVICALSVAPLNVGHLVGVERQMPVGAAVLTATLQGSRVRFNLDSCVLRPSDPANSLLLWLDRHLTTEGATITAYRMTDAVALLEQLPGANWSPALCALAGCGQQYVLDLSANADGGPLSFQQACAHSQILCAPVDPSRRFARWVRSDIGEVEQDAQLDVLATFRLVMRRLAAVSPVGKSLETAISKHFASWLEHADHAAAQLHVADLLSTAD